jgi:hypothetical protein
VICRIRGSSSATTFGVNALPMSLRSLVCSGGSVIVSAPSLNDSSISVAASRLAMLFENDRESRRTSSISR